MRVCDANVCLTLGINKRTCEYAGTGVLGISSSNENASGIAFASSSSSAADGTCMALTAKRKKRVNGWTDGRRG